MAGWPRRELLRRGAVNLIQIAKFIAQESGLGPAVGESLGSYVLPPFVENAQQDPLSKEVAAGQT